MPDGAENSCVRVLPGGRSGGSAAVPRAFAPDHPAVPAEQAGSPADSALRPSLTPAGTTGTTGPAAHRADAGDTATLLAEARPHPLPPEGRAPSAPPGRHLGRRGTDRRPDRRRRGTAHQPDHHPAHTDGSAPGPSVPPLSAAGDLVATPRPAHVSLVIRTRTGQPYGTQRESTHCQLHARGVTTLLGREAPSDDENAHLIRVRGTRTGIPREAPRARTGMSSHPHG